MKYPSRKSPPQRGAGDKQCLSINYPDNAQARCHQRQIPPLLLDWLKHYEATSFDKQGARIRYFDKESNCHGCIEAQSLQG